MGNDSFGDSVMLDLVHDCDFANFRNFLFVFECQKFGFYVDVLRRGDFERL